MNKQQTKNIAYPADSKFQYTAQSSTKLRQQGINSLSWSPQ